MTRVAENTAPRTTHNAQQVAKSKPAALPQSSADSLETLENKSYFSVLTNQFINLLSNIWNFISKVLFSLITDSELERLNPLLKELDEFYNLMTYHNPKMGVATSAKEIKEGFENLSPSLKEMLLSYLQKTLEKEGFEASEENLMTAIETCSGHFRTAIRNCHADLLLKVGIR